MAEYFSHVMKAILKNLEEIRPEKKKTVLEIIKSIFTTAKSNQFW